MKALLCWPWTFSRALSCGTRKGGATTLGRTFGPRPGSVARALGVRSRASFLFFEGFRSRPAV